MLIGDEVGEVHQGEATPEVEQGHGADLPGPPERGVSASASLAPTHV